jgi:hypothetical protein
MPVAVTSGDSVRSFSCQRCGNEHSCASNVGRLPKWCSNCRRKQRSEAERSRVRKRQQNSQRKQCEQCGLDWSPKRQSTRFCSPRCRSLAAGTRVVLQCVFCEKSFDVCSAYAGSRKYCSRECSRNDRSAEERTCVECGCAFKRRKHAKDKAKYCGRKCYFAARAAGRQPWSRSDAQNEAIWHIGGRWFRAPSRVPMREMMTNMSSFLSRVRSLYEKASRHMPACEVCGSLCKTQEARFCSPRCCGQNVHEVGCCKCGARVKRRGVGKVVLCHACKQNAKREALRRIRETCGKNHPSRARHYGVQCQRFPRKMIFDRDGWRCQLCGTSVLRKTTYRKRDGKIHPRSPTVDCIVPMSKGGNYEPDNCQTACFICNSKKGAKRIGQLRLPIL